ncbi:MAG: 3-dehydroquinate synthase [Gemmatimonadales bacterium]
MTVRHRAGSYPVVVHHGAVSELAGVLARHHSGRRAVVISDSNVADILPTPLPGVISLTFPEGERHKTRESWSTLTDQLLAHDCGRDTVLIAFGGGVTTDLVGFVAATYLRGVPWIAIPTTTLAMVDAAVGGKTGVDTARGKNLVGAIHHPEAVLVDPALLATLPERIFREGLAEAAKHAAILDAAHGAWLSGNAAAIDRRNLDTLTALVRRSIELKAGIVSEDEFESGPRAVLNAGHTVAHALEQVTGYGIPHGEAVAIGLVLETRCAERMGICTAGTAEQLVELLTALHLPVACPADTDASALIAAMGSDKKNRAGVVRAALLKEFGEVARDGDAWTLPLDLELLRALV